MQKAHTKTLLCLSNERKSCPHLKLVMTVLILLSFLLSMENKTRREEKTKPRRRKNCSLASARREGVKLRGQLYENTILLQPFFKKSKLCILRLSD